MKRRSILQESLSAVPFDITLPLGGFEPEFTTCNREGKGGQEAARYVEVEKTNHAEFRFAFSSLRIASADIFAPTVCRQRNR